MPEKMDSASLVEAINTCLYKDRVGLMRLLTAIQKRQQKKEPTDMLEKKLTDGILRAQKSLACRDLSPYQLTLNESLPIAAAEEKIRTLLTAHQVIIVAGETGSGKTSQLPKLCLNMNLAEFGMIALTQPRRIAARSIRSRLQEETNSLQAPLIGLKTRFDDKIHVHNLVRVMTDGVLLSELEHDKRLLKYQCIIIDEAHERSLNIDFLFGALKRILDKRPDLKVIIASATIDAEKFSTYFNNAPLVEVSGRSYPVDVLYRPIEHYGQESTDIAKHVLKAVNECNTIGDGDILVFLSGEREIKSVQASIDKQKLRNTETVALYARQSQAIQQKIFKPHSKRYIILTTNVAETSITVPGIRFVIDSGVARISRYNIATRVQSLPIEKISKASAKQRAGRCGRVQHGTCLRLYSEEDFEARDEFNIPEILRTNLAEVVLKIKSLKLEALETFPFLDKPELKYLNDGVRTLNMIQAIDKDGHITKEGKLIASLPIDPVLGKIALTGKKMACLHEMLILCAYFSVPTPSEYPSAKQKQRDDAFQKFVDKESDFMTIINLWHWFVKEKNSLSNSKLSKLLKEEYLSYTRMLQWFDIYNQLKDALVSKSEALSGTPADYASIHRALLSGFMLHVAILDEKGLYTGVRNVKLIPFPGNMVTKKPKIIMAQTLLQTHKSYAVTIAGIQLNWLEHAAKHLLKRNYDEPFWDEKKQAVLARETLSFYGLIISANKKVYYGKLDGLSSRTIFIREALVAEGLNSTAPFYVDNQKILREAETLEHKLRRKDVLSEEVQYDWYDSVLPKDIFCLASFDRWQSKLSDAEHRALTWTVDDLLQQENYDTSFYPDELPVNDFKVKLGYLFNPTLQKDGLIATVKLSELDGLPDYFQDWLVPGLLSEKILFLLKGLPKSIRKTLVPIKAVADELAASGMAQDKPLQTALVKELRRLKNIQLQEDAFSCEDLPPYLCMTLQVVNTKGEVIASGTEVRELKLACGKLKQKSVERLHEKEPLSEKLTAWHELVIPEVVTKKSGSDAWQVYPGLVDKKDYVTLKHFAFQAERDIAHLKGIARLHYFTLSKAIKYCKKNIPHLKELALYYHRVDNKDNLVDDILMFAITSLLDDGINIRNKQQFETSVNSVSKVLQTRINTVAKVLHKTFLLHHKLFLTEPNEALCRQLGLLIYPKFLYDVPFNWFKRLPLYLEAYSRSQRQHTAEDEYRTMRQWYAKWESLVNQYQDNNKVVPTNVLDFKWHLEEYMIACFAQTLKTVKPISIKRLQKEWDSITR